MNDETPDMSILEEVELITRYAESDKRTIEIIRYAIARHREGTTPNDWQQALDVLAGDVDQLRTYCKILDDDPCVINYDYFEEVVAFAATSLADVLGAFHRAHRHGKPTDKLTLARLEANKAQPE